MRISDWSSDVCSSDLKGALDAGANDAALRPLLARAYAMQGEGARALETLKSGPVIPEMLGEAAWVAGDVHLANGDLAAAREAYDRAVHELPLSRSEEHTSELQSLMRISYAVFCLQKKKQSSRKS